MNNMNAFEKAAKSWPNKWPSTNVAAGVLHLQLVDHDKGTVTAMQELIKGSKDRNVVLSNRLTVVEAASSVILAFDEYVPEETSYQPMWPMAMVDPEGYASLMAEDPVFGMLTISSLMLEGLPGMAALAMVGESTLDLLYTGALTMTDTVIADLKTLTGESIGERVNIGDLVSKEFKELSNDQQKEILTVFEKDDASKQRYIVSSASNIINATLYTGKIDYLTLSELKQWVSELEKENELPPSDLGESRGPESLETSEIEESLTEDDAIVESMPDEVVTVASSVIDSDLEQIVQGKTPFDESEAGLSFLVATSGTKEAKRHAFIQKIFAAAESSKVVNKSVIPAEWVVTIAAIESSWGEQMPKASNNVFGIKATNWNGESTVAETQEVIDGKRITINDSFRSYKSLAQAVNDLYSVLNHSRYQPVRDIAASWDGDMSLGQEIGDAFHKAGYATDPNYGKLWKGVLGGRSFMRYLPNEFRDDVTRLVSKSYSNFTQGETIA